MNILFENALIIDPRSPWHMQKADVHVENGFLKKIANNISINGEVEKFKSENLVISPGWIDLFSHFTDPGEEQKEDVKSGLNAASAGGFTKVAILPNTTPVIDSKSQVEYLLRKAQDNICDLMVIGSISQQSKGQNIAEMIDMYHAGAVAFSDGLHAIQNDALMSKALEFSKSFDAPLIQMPLSESLKFHGLMHEGDFSVKYGMAGIPDIAEHMMVYRDCELVKYTDAKIHFTGISSAKSMTWINQAKKDKLKVTCSISPFHLLFIDEDLSDYNNLYKLSTPLRSKEDRKKLKQALIKGEIDAVASHHLPVDTEGKEKEFAYSDDGMTSLQTVLPALLLAEIPLEIFAQILSINPAKILNQNLPIIEEGATANLTFFDPEKNWIFNNESNKSKSKNNIWFNKELKGKVLGIINNNKLFKNQ